MFTDDDLKRLKELLNDPQASGFFTEEMAKGILARLEAAERAAADTGSNELYKAWCKACGK